MHNKITSCTKSFFSDLNSGKVRANMIHKFMVDNDFGTCETDFKLGNTQFN